MTAPSAQVLYREAQVLLRQGQPVFPVKTVGEKAKAPLTKNGLHDASLDLPEVKSWWKRYGNKAAIGIPTGILWDVLDVDIKDSADGRVHLPYLAKIGLLNGCQFVVKTPSGGWHLYFKAAPSLKLGNKGRAASLGLDVRGKGGYVLAPPSFIQTPEYKGVYQHMGETIGGTDEPLRWDLIVNALNPLDEVTKQPIMLLPSERLASIAALREWVTTLKEGERNNGFHWAISRCIEGGIDPYELAEPASLIGLTDDEIRKTIGSALVRTGVQVEELSSEVEALFPDDLADDADPDDGLEDFPFHMAEDD